MEDYGRMKDLHHPFILNREPKIKNLKTYDGIRLEPEISN